MKDKRSKAASLFDAPSLPATTATESDEEEEILAETADEGHTDEDEGFDEAA